MDTMRKRSTAMTRKPTTLREVAQVAGVTPMTVSNVLRGAGHASRETCETVLRAAKSLNYHPNDLARSLTRRRTNIIGLYSGSGYMDAANEFLSEIICGLQEGCDRFGKDLLLHGKHKGRSAIDIYRELASGKIDGLVVVYATPELEELLADSHLPVVNVADQSAHLPSVLVDDAQGSRLLAQHLKSRGYTRVFYRHGAKLPSALARMKAFQDEAKTLGLKVSMMHSRNVDFLTDAETKTLLDPQSRGAAFVCWEDDSARTLYRFCKAHGLRVPQDIALTGFNGVIPHRQTTTLTTIRAPWREAAATAFALVANYDGTDLPSQTVLPVELLVGETT